MIRGEEDHEHVGPGEVGEFVISAIDTGEVEIGRRVTDGERAGAGGVAGLVEEGRGGGSRGGLGEDGRERSEETRGGEARGAAGVLGEEHAVNV